MRSTGPIRFYSLIASVLLAMMLVAACGGDASPDATTADTPATTPTPATVATPASTPAAPAPTPSPTAVPPTLPRLPPLPRRLPPLPRLRQSRRQPRRPQLRQPHAPTPTPVPLFPLTITDSNGNDITFDAPPERIIAFDSAAVEILFALGEQDRIAGTHAFVDYPPKPPTSPGWATPSTWTSSRS